MSLRIVGPVTQGVKVERAPERCGGRRSFDASQRIAASPYRTHHHPCMWISIAHGMSPGTGPYTGTRPESFGATKGQGGPRPTVL